MRAHLLWLGDGTAPPAWKHGETVAVTANVHGINRAVNALPAAVDDLLVFWDSELGTPNLDPVRLAQSKGEVWHAGLSLGQLGRPELLSFVHPTWMLQRDPSPSIPASSWRLSLRACLIPVELWRRFGGPREDIHDLHMAALEMGFRWWRCGALMRHEPEMVADHRVDTPVATPALEDELRFLRAACGTFWSAWAGGRAVLTGARTALGLWRAWAATRGTARRPLPPARPAVTPPDKPTELPTVAVLIPTLDRYPYLTVVLDQLRQQTVPPHEIVVIDQTAPDRRDRQWQNSFSDLPLRVIERDPPGQSSARNAGLQTLTSDFVLFIDDDVEIEPDLIERHWQNLYVHNADASCGVTREPGAGPLPEDFQRRRMSDVFPTCNCMARIDALRKSGLFDLAFDHGSRADADLGTRIYLSGGLMVLEPSISVFHHKAPSGGLRQHGARVVTYADSRRRLWARHLPNATELYLAQRYFTPDQAKEARLLRLLGTLKGRGSRGRKLLKGIIGLLQLPSTYRSMRRAETKAQALLQRYPQIPELDDHGDRP